MFHAGTSRELAERGNSMVNKKLVLLVLVVISVSCSSNKGVLTSSAPTISGTLSGSGGPLQDAEVKLKSYKDENCAKLAQQKKLSQEEDQQFKQCTQQVSATTADAQGKYAFPSVPDGWYSLEVIWTTKEDPLKSNPFWKPLFMYHEEGFLVTFMATKDSSFRVLAIGVPFQVSGGNGVHKDLKLKL